MPHSRDNHPDNRGADVGTSLIEREEVEARFLGNLHAGVHLLARVDKGRLSKSEAGWTFRSFVRRQEGIVLQATERCRRGSICSPSPPISPMDRSRRTRSAHAARRCARRNARQSRIRYFPAESFTRWYHHEASNPEVACDVKHPKPAPGYQQLGLQIADVGIVELAEVHLRPLQAIVPPDRVCITLHQLKEA